MAKRTPFHQARTSAILSIAAGAVIIAVPASLAWIVGIYLIVNGALALIPNR